MRIRFICLIGLMSLMLAAASLSAQGTPSEMKIIGYFASWAIYDREYFVTDIPAEMLTHLNYAFAGISEDGEIALLDEWGDTQFPYPGDADDQPLKGNFNQLQLLKEANPHLQTLISVGGWTESARFSDVALTEASRQKFAASVVDFITQYGFDGVDLDWEYPTGGGESGNVERAEDPENFVLLLAELRAQLDALEAADGHHYPLTIALGADNGAYDPLDWTRIVPLLDWINVMDYDMSGSWSEVTGFNAPLYDSTDNPPEGTSADTSLTGLLALGVPAEKLVMGVPFYGHAWSGVEAADNGRHQPYTGTPNDEGSIDYRDIVGMIAGSERFWDATAQVPWLYDAESGTMISYDDPESLAAKAAYVREHGLGGIMIWELSQDTADSALLTAVYEGLNGAG
ncbi:MAG: glycoside hydrolase family 18 protein [Chloroflexota bacterium]